MSIHACPYCGTTTTIPSVLRGHTRQECESRIRDRIDHWQGCIDREQQSLDALHAASNADQQVPAHA